MHTIGFIGLGVMGLPMARNLARADHALKVWNRTPARCAEIPEATPVARPADLADCTVVFVNVADDAALEAVLFGPGGLASEGGSAIVVDMGTTSPAYTRDCAQHLRELGMALLDAPVSGGEAGAEAGTLSIMVGGDAEVYAKVLPLFECLGRNIVHVGASGAGQIAKACNQIVVSATLMGVAEAFHFARRQGVDPARVRAALLGGSAYSKILEIHGQRMLDGNDQPGFRARLHKKDLDIVMAEATGLGLSLESIQAAARLMSQLVDAGQGDLDSSALHTLIK
ncbi:MAG: NAD(P)-dependent oxidoreductase [Hydrogenophilales bacterium]|nr:NAD(P)-dependent oxidoreductase [Hydrogenophilales bacterium]